MKHITALDGLRGIAILLVFTHTFDVLGAPLDIGWLGVQLFFVLSGFLITGVLLDTRTSPTYYRSFLGRRVLRILPLYYAVLAVAFLLVPVITHRSIAGAEHQLWLWTYLSNWAEPVGRGVPLFPHFWSLAIEEQFYLAWPFLVREIAPRTRFRLCVGIAALALAARIAMLANGSSATSVYMFTICRIDALAIGAGVAVLARTPGLPDIVQRMRRKLRVGALFLLGATVVLTHGAPRTGVWTQTFGYTLFAIGFAALVLDAATAHPRGRVARALAAPPLRAAGKSSYAMYVFHTPLHLLIGLPLLAHVRVTVPIALAYMVVATLATFAAAFVSYHLLEKHVLRLKARFA